MDTIEVLATKAGVRVLYAVTSPRGGTFFRVAPGQAGTAAAILDATDTLVEVSLDGSEVAVEVAGPWGIPQVDHHGKHPNAGRPPAEALAASSVGQAAALFLEYDYVLPWKRILGPSGNAGDFMLQQGQWFLCDGPQPDGDSCWWVVPDEIVAVAADDHCAGSAWAGMVPGTDFHQGGVSRAVILDGKHRTFAPQMSVGEFTAAVETAVETLRVAPTCEALGGDVGDITRLDLPIDGPITTIGEQYPSAFQFGPIVAGIVGRGYVAPIKSFQRDETGQWAFRADAIRLGGCGPSTRAGIEPIQNWLDGVGEQIFNCLPADAPAPSNLYGVPARGFAGGTRKP